jgi:hypothetical protein
MAFIPCFVPKVPPINISDPIWNSTVSNSLVLNRPGITGMRVLARPTQPKTGIFPQPAFIESKAMEERWRMQKWPPIVCAAEQKLPSKRKRVPSAARLATE